MNVEFVLDSLEYLDAELIEEAGREAPGKRRRWIIWAAAAACLCLLVGVGLLLRGREAIPEGVQKWSASMSAADYFKDCGGEGGRKQISFGVLRMLPYAAAMPLDEERLEAEGIALPTVQDRPARSFEVCYNGDGSLYKVVVRWELQPEDRDVYTVLTLSAAPKELHEVSDTVITRLDEKGAVIPPDLTLTLRDGITIQGEGGEGEPRTLTWQTEEGWYQLYGDADKEEELVALLDWFWAHPLSLDRFRELASECFTCCTREERPEAFRAQIPDFEALGYTAESEQVYLASRYGDGEREPVGFVGVYVRGETRVRWSLSIGADRDAFDASLGRPKEVREGKLTEALAEKNYVNLHLTEAVMATLRLEQGAPADAWEIVQSMQR